MSIFRHCNRQQPKLHDYEDGPRRRTLRERLEPALVELTWPYVDNRPLITASNNRRGPWTFGDRPEPVVLQPCSRPNPFPGRVQSLGRTLPSICYSTDPAIVVERLALVS